MRQPERIEEERRFAEEHQNDTDEELVEYAIQLKRKMGKRFKRQNVIGYRYFVKRFGGWDVFMNRVNRRIKNNSKTTGDLEN